MDLCTIPDSTCLKSMKHSSKMAMTEQQFFNAVKYMRLTPRVVDMRIQFGDSGSALRKALDESPELEAKLILRLAKNRPDLMGAIQEYACRCHGSQHSDKLYSSVLQYINTTRESQKEKRRNEPVAGDERHCSIRDFVKAITLPTSKKLYQNWFSLAEAVSGAKENGCAVSNDTALEYLSFLVQRGYFLIRGEGDNVQYKKHVFSYAMDFWNDSPNK